MAGFEVSTEDVVHRYRYLEARHIRALIGGSDQQITRRLQGLFHNGYLGRYARRERMRIDLEPGAPLIAYGLETRGARALEATGTIDRTATEAVPWRKEYTRRTDWFLEHHLMISGFRCILELALRESPDSELVSWRQGKDIWFRAAIPGRRGLVRIAPDAYFVLRQRGQERHYFLEADRSTEEHRRLVDKLVGYWWYLQDRRFIAPDRGRQRVNVLFLTTGARRMLNMIETLRRMPKPNRAEHGGKGLFRFCCAVSYGLEDPVSLLGAIWSSVDGVRTSLLVQTSGTPPRACGG